MSDNDIKTDKLGLAVYMKMNGAKLNGVEGRAFCFSTEIPQSQWEMRYANSTESQFNSQLIELNHLRRNHK